jgi:hypothetical protein
MLSRVAARLAEQDTARPTHTRTRADYAIRTNNQAANEQNRTRGEVGARRLVAPLPKLPPPLSIPLSCQFRGIAAFRGTPQHLPALLHFPNPRKNNAVTKTYISCYAVMLSKV